MDNYTKELLQSAVHYYDVAGDYLHRLMGYLDAQSDFKPILQIFPGGTDKQKEDEKREIEQSEDSTVFAIKFTEQEIKQMPKTFRKSFRIKGCNTHIRKRSRGADQKSCSYELRYRADGYNISVSARTVERVKAKFIKKLNEIDNREQLPTENVVASAPQYRAVAPNVPTKFHDFTMYYFENFRKRKIVRRTYESDLRRYNRHILPHFGNVELYEITPLLCQNLLESLDERGLGKTKDEIRILLNQTFKMAIKHRIIDFNPLDVVFHLKHTTKHGKALTIEEEKKLLAETSGEAYQLMFAVALYTGLRPYEYKSARLENGIIIAQNCKRKDAAHGAIVYKRIPVSPMLRPYLKGTPDGVIRMYIPEVMRERFCKILPNHKLYDLRTTFYTRCQECDVAPPARDEFVGHSLGKLGDTYTDLPDEYLKREAEKLKY